MFRLLCLIRNLLNADQKFKMGEEAQKVKTRLLWHSSIAIAIILGLSPNGSARIPGTDLILAGDSLRIVLILVILYQFMHFISEIRSDITDQARSSVDRLIQQYEQTVSGLRGIHSELSFAPNRYLGSIITQFGDEEICRQVRQIIDNALKDITPDELEARLDSDRVDQLTKMVASTIIPTYEELKMYVSARVKNAHQSAEQLIEDCELIARSVHKRQRILRSTRNITNWFFDVFFPVTYGLMAMIFAVWPTGLTALVGTLASWLPER